MRNDETDRLKTLHGYRLLDTAPEPEFDAVVRQAASEFEVPIALMSLVDSDRQWFKAKVGLEADETPRSVSFCSYAIENDDVMVVPDARADTRFRENPLVIDEPLIRFYAGAPIVAENGSKIGTICIIDRKPRAEFTDAEKQALAGLSSRISAILASRKRCEDDAA